MVRNLMPAGWEDMDLLDIGVGDGYTIRLLKPSGRVSGVDFDPRAVLSAKERGVDAREGSAYDLPFPSDSFGVVTCIEVLEHLENPQAALDQVSRLLRPGGYFIVTTPVPNLRWKVLWWLWTKFGPGKRWDKIPHITDLHVGGKSSNDGGLVAMLEERGLEVTKTSRCNYGMVAGLTARKRMKT